MFNFLSLPVGYPYRNFLRFKFVGYIARCVGPEKEVLPAEFYRFVPDIRRRLFGTRVFGIDTLEEFRFALQACQVEGRTGLDCVGIGNCIPKRP